MISCKASIVMATAMQILSSLAKANDCQLPALLHQHRDIATIEALELVDPRLPAHGRVHATSWQPKTVGKW
jgi:hypothetical protein